MLKLERLYLIAIIIVLLASCASPQAIPLQSGSWRGVWVQRKSIMSQPAIDEVIRRAQLGGFKQIFADVFTGGMTLYPSQFAAQKSGVEPGFDPLAYLVQEAHKRQIQVHAWFEVGRVADAKGNSLLLQQHPEWALVGPDGGTLPWLNFGLPEARQFIADIMLEAVQRGVDGIHFDYTRYPGAEWSFDPYSIEAFNRSHDFDLNELRYADLPAYGQFEGNALLQPSTARILAEFSNGYPAVIFNEYGDGQILILNWQANQRKTAIGDAILKRGIDQFLGPQGYVYILQSRLNALRYGEGDFDATVSWLETFVRNPVKLPSQQIDGLDPDSVLVIPSVYLFTWGEAAQLARFAQRGGTVIFIDSPTPSMHWNDMRALTGMQAEHDHFEGWLLMTANGDHPLIPVSDRPADIELYKQHNVQWQAFRAAGINGLIQDVYQRVKALSPDTLITVTITSDQQQAASEDLQDWQAWLDTGYIDMLIPRAYENTLEELDRTLHAWKPVTMGDKRLLFGLISYVANGKDENRKSAAQLAQEINMALAAGSNGYVIFDLDRMSDSQLRALAQSIP